MGSYLIGYVPPEKNHGHADPLLEELTYGDKGDNGKKLWNNVQKGDHIFFHTTIRKKRYLTAFYVVEAVMLVKDAKNNPDIFMKYNNPHLKKELLDPFETIIFGNLITSRILEAPLEITEELLERLSRKANLNKEQEMQAAISSALRSWKALSDADVTLLKEQINTNRNSSRLARRLFSTEEIFQVAERDIESFVIEHPEVFGQDIRVHKSQHVLKNDEYEGRLDVWLENSRTNEYIIAEIKKGPLDRNSLKQVQRYMKLIEKEYPLKSVRGILLGSSITPAFESELLSQEKIDIYLYGWEFQVSKVE